MRALIYREFNGPLTVENVPDPALPDDGVIVEVKANGICRSDWHGWMGHDADIHLPHVPGHELAGYVTEVGRDVRHWPHRGDAWQRRTSGAWPVSPRLIMPVNAAMSGGRHFGPPLYLYRPGNRASGKDQRPAHRLIERPRETGRAGAGNGLWLSGKYPG